MMKIPIIGNRHVIPKVSHNQSSTLFANKRLTLGMQFHLRPVEERDIPNISKLGNNINIARFLTGHFPHPYTLEAAQKFYEMAINENPYRRLIIDVNGECAGVIGAHPKEDIHEKCAEVGYWLGEPYWGNGIMTKAVKEIFAYTFIHFDVVRVFARPYSNNPGSKKVLEKANLCHEATLKKSIYRLGEVLDEHIFSLLRDDFFDWAKLEIRKANDSDIPFLNEEIKNMNLDGRDFDIHEFTMATLNNSRAAFVRVKNHGDCKELLSLGVKPLVRNGNIGKKLVNHLQSENNELYLATVIPNYFEKLNFKSVNEFPKSLHQKVNDCATKHHEENIFIMRNGNF